MSPTPSRPPIHVLVIGDYGAGKSTFAATFPKPMLVFQFDAFGKDFPYLNRPGTEVSALFSDAKADWVRTVSSTKSGKLLIRLEYYHELEWTEPREVTRKAGKTIRDVNPSAYNTFLKRMAGFHHEYEEWATVVLDSATPLEIAARRWDQFIVNPGAEDARQWYGASKDLLERMLFTRFAGLPMNVVVLAHIDDEKYEFQGKQRRVPMLPGKLRGSLGSQYQEVYHAYIVDNGEYLLQTRTDALFACTSAIQAPNPCPPHYDALWAGAPSHATAEGR
jgi:AAA domain